MDVCELDQYGNKNYEFVYDKKPWMHFHFHFQFHSFFLEFVEFFFFLLVQNAN